MSENTGDGSSEVYECPICGSEVPGTEDRCPGCGAWFDTSRLQCPICSEEVDVDVEVCPKCGTLFGEGDAEGDLDLFDDLTCPICGTSLDEEDTICPGCGQEIEITEVDDEGKPLYPVPLSTDFRLPDDGGMVNGRGMTNGAGMTNGVGMVNGSGMVNGRGMTNGAGMVNGRGMVNGKGLTNGSGMVNGAGMVNGRGMVNGSGMVNGRGMINGSGMVNGRGMVNGHGLTNGSGMVNGAGFINGRGGSDTELNARKALVNGRGIFDYDDGERLLSTRMIIPPKRHRAKPLAMALVFIMILVLVGAMVIMVPTSGKKIVIDGEFEDWKGIPRHTDRTGDYQNSNLDILSYAITTDGDDLAVYVQVAGTILDGNTPLNGVDTLIVFFDVDGEDTTGYRLYGMGIDYIVEVAGWDNDVQRASVKEFRDNRDPQDWNGFTSIGAISAASRGSSMEIKVTAAADWMDDPEARFNMNLQTNQLDGDWTPFTIERPGALEVRQTSLGVVGQHLEAGGQDAVLRIDVAAYDVDANLGYLTVVSALDTAPTLLDLGRCDLFLDSNRNGHWDSGDHSQASDNWGTGDDGGISFNMEDSPIIVPKGTIERLFVVVTVGGAPQPGKAVKMNVEDWYAVEAEDIPVTVLPVDGRASYIETPELPVTIDGLFEDWHYQFEENGGNLTRHVDPLGDGLRPSIDLSSFAMYEDPEPGAGRALFYVEVDPTSKVLLGTQTPLSNLQRPSGGGGGGGGGGGEPPVVFGDDRALIYLDMEGVEPSQTLYGQRVTHVIDAAGLNGVVRSTGLWKYTGTIETPWVRMDRDVEAAAGVHELEVSLDLTDVAGPVRTAVIVLRGWDGATDAGSPKPIQDLDEETRTGGLGEGPLPIPEFDDLVIPAACTLVAYALVRRRKRS